MAGNVAKAVLDLLFPPLCIACRAQVGEAGFCASCWSGITFLDGPGCACCGLPFPVALEGENICAACLARPPAFDTARAILVYDQTSRGAVLALKHADRLDLVPGFARWLSRVGRAALDDSNLVVPVRHRERQAAAGAAGTVEKGDAAPAGRIKTRPDHLRAAGDAERRKQQVQNRFGDIPSHTLV
jgi:predicted amidophosphoribosyltransferase